MTLADHVTTFGQDLLRCHGERVHKLAINAGFTCPNRDGSKGTGGCTFCNNASFTPAARVLDLGVDGLKLHPLHVVKGTALANTWRRGEYVPLRLDEYLGIAADVVERTPSAVVFHRLTGTAASHLLLAPDWCATKWQLLNGIERELVRRGTRQGSRCANSAGAAWGGEAARTLPFAGKPAPAMR